MNERVQAKIQKLKLLGAKFLANNNWGIVYHDDSGYKFINTELIDSPEYRIWPNFRLTEHFFFGDLLVNQGGYKAAILVRNKPNNVVRGVASVSSILTQIAYDSKITGYYNKRHEIVLVNYAGKLKKCNESCITISAIRPVGNDMHTLRNCTYAPDPYGSIKTIEVEVYRADGELNTVQYTLNNNE